jgi:hypothetical protein
LSPGWSISKWRAPPGPANDLMNVLSRNTVNTEGRINNLSRNTVNTEGRMKIQEIDNSVEWMLMVFLLKTGSSTLREE